ncbi:MAG: MmgE/PrpD family protein [Paracoccaceae bacterium]|nr:MmgE/PrpD family protein [Paracoccaceae bacterium]
MDHLGCLAAATATATPPEEVRAKSALILADTVGAIVGGSAEAEVRALTNRLVGEDGGAAFVIGSGGRATPRIAALLNGTAGTALEMDEGHQFAKGHPAIHVIPAILAVALTTECTGRDLLNAVTMGYEAAARVGVATSLRPSMHPHGTWGAIGAAVGVLRMSDLPAETHRDAMNMAASLGSTPSRNTMLEGATVRNVFAGVSNQMGLLVSDLAASGFSGDREGVAQVFGQTVSDTFDETELSRDLGDRWEVMRNYFKMHSCCRFNHAALDAVDLLLADETDIRTDEIAKITVDTYGLAVELDDPEPRNVLAAKFSVPFAIATRFTTGSSGVESFAAERVNDEATLALARRIELREDPRMSARLPDERPARISLTTRDGRELTAETRTNRGDWRDPFTENQLHEKFLSLTARQWSRDHSEDVWSACLELDREASATTLLDLLATGESDA